MRIEKLHLDRAIAASSTELTHAQATAAEAQAMAAEAQATVTKAQAMLTDRSRCDARAT